MHKLGAMTWCIVCIARRVLELSSMQSVDSSTADTQHNRL